MVNKKDKYRNGYLLVELLLNITIMLVLVGAIFAGFALTSRLHYQMMNYLAMQSQLRFVADSIVRDVTYSDECKVQPHKLIIYTKHDQPNGKVFSYEINNKRVVRDKQPMTGDEFKRNIRVENFSCFMPSSKLVIIKLQAVDVITKKDFSVETAAVIRNYNKENRYIKLPE